MSVVGEDMGESAQYPCIGLGIAENSPALRSPPDMGDHGGRQGTMFGQEPDQFAVHRRHWLAHHLHVTAPIGHTPAVRISGNGPLVGEAFPAETYPHRCTGRHPE